MIGWIVGGVVAFASFVAWLLVKRAQINAFAKQIGTVAPAKVIEMTQQVANNQKVLTDKEVEALREAPLGKKIDFARAIRDRGRGVRPSGDN